jgi:hypothetical protein
MFHRLSSSSSLPKRLLTEHKNLKSNTREAASIEGVTGLLVTGNLRLRCLD